MGPPGGRPYTWGMECRGVVTAREGGLARVLVSASDCAECGACGVFSRRGGRDVEFTVLIHGTVREGDVVVLEIPGREVLTSFLVVFVLPLLAMAAAYLVIAFLLLAITGAVNQGAAVGVAAAVGGLSFWWSAKLVGRRLVHPRVVAVFGREPEGMGSETDAD